MNPVAKRIGIPHKGPQISLYLASPEIRDQGLITIVEQLENALATMGFVIHSPFRDGHYFTALSSAQSRRERLHAMQHALCHSQFVVACCVTPAIKIHMDSTLAMVIGMATALCKPVIAYTPHEEPLPPAINATVIGHCCTVGTLHQILCLARDLYTHGNAPLPEYYHEHMQRFAYDDRV